MLEATRLAGPHELAAALGNVKYFPCTLALSSMKAIMCSVEEAGGVQRRMGRKGARQAQRCLWGGIRWHAAGRARARVRAGLSAL